MAGVCNFAEPQGDHGLYATPRSIYSVLDRNNLAALYAPVESGKGTLVASRGDRAASRGDVPITVARGQSPEGHEGERARHRPGDVTIPAPELLGIKPPLRAGLQAGPLKMKTLKAQPGGWPGSLEHESSDSSKASRRRGRQDRTDRPEPRCRRRPRPFQPLRGRPDSSDPAASDPAATKKSTSEKSINPEDVPASACPAASPSAKSRRRPAHPPRQPDLRRASAVKADPGQSLLAGCLCRMPQSHHWGQRPSEIRRLPVAGCRLPVAGRRRRLLQRLFGSSNSPPSNHSISSL